jgi:TonB family protein
MTKRLFACLSWTGLLLLSACSSVPVDQLTVGTNMITAGGATNKWEEIPMTAVELKSPVYMVTYIQWPDVTSSAGRHDVHWTWFRDGRPVHTFDAKGIELKSSPFRLWCRVQAAGLGVGHIHVDMAIDGRSVATNDFDVISVIGASGRDAGAAPAAAATYSPGAAASDSSIKDLLTHCANAVDVARDVGFPAKAAAAGVTAGTVTLSMLLGTDGSIRNVAVLKSSNAVFDQAAIDTVLRLKCSAKDLTQDLSLRWEMVYKAQ